MVSDQTCVTSSKKKTYSSSWKIEDFEMRRDEKLTSILFFGTNFHGENVEWNFIVDTNATDCDGVYPLVQISCLFKSILKKQKVEVKFMPESNSIFGYIDSDTDFAFYLVPSEKEKWLSSDGSLELHFMVTLLHDVIEQTLPSLPPSTLAESYANLLQSEQFAELTITAGQQIFRAHKTILVARSTVFAAMFQHDMQESQRNEFTIVDVEPKVFEEVLRFIYTDKVKELPQMAHELLAAADKYDLARLKVMCEIQLFEGISAESATKTLIFADLHRAKELKARAIEFLSRNLKAVSNWVEFCREKPDLVAEIMEKIASYN
uniref:Speckle-type POZ protein-like A n=1 Tax=Culex pipiens TaxID=7175 RepID=A0A8D8MGS4_CULPI